MMASDHRWRGNGEMHSSRDSYSLFASVSCLSGSSLARPNACMALLSGCGYLITSLLSWAQACPE